MKYDEDEYTFSSGRRVCSNLGIIGISPNLELFEGYDGRLGGCHKLTKEDRIELADYMIERWGKFKEQAPK